MGQKQVTPRWGVDERWRFRLYREKWKMETTVVYWCYIGIVEKKMETAVVFAV